MALKTLAATKYIQNHPVDIPEMKERVPEEVVACLQDSRYIILHAKAIIYKKNIIDAYESDGFETCIDIKLQLRGAYVIGDQYIGEGVGSVDFFDIAEEIDSKILGNCQNLYLYRAKITLKGYIARNIKTQQVLSTDIIYVKPQTADFNCVII